MFVPGAEVHAGDGKIGVVDELVADPETGEVTHFILREGHSWGKRDVLLPVSSIRQVIREKIYLNLDAQAIGSMLAIPTRQRRGDTSLSLLTLTLNQANQANDVVKTLKALAKDDAVTIPNVAVLTKDQDDQTTVREAEDIDPRRGALFGAITGGLIGLLGGPVGAVVGAAAGAATGGAAAKRIDMGFPDAYLEKLQASLQPGSAAIVALVEAEGVEPVTQALSAYEGDLINQTVTDEMLAQFTEEASGE